MIDGRVEVALDRRQDQEIKIDGASAGDAHIHLDVLPR